ncbi:tyrosine-type recombinase/integrase [Nonomuraea sp. NPDC052265]|uniref:tyrosine-type recombinase/integrase n=1 Tax=Nonomuraea sp. NPDC052265 TaxID=3364374 RepID=UPI0037C584A1
MSVVAFLGQPDPAPVGPTTATAVDRFLDSITAATTRAGYAETLRRLLAVTGVQFPAAALQPEHYAAAMERWTAATAATWNRHLSALTSFTTWAQRQEILATNPARRLERRKSARRGDRSIPRARLETLFTDDPHALRKRVLWRLLYETAARAEEILTLNIEDLDPEFRRARVTSKGGAIEYVHWATPTARLLPRLLAGRTSGPVFLADRRAPTSGPKVPADGDMDPTNGTRRYNISPRQGAARPSCKPRAATSTWPASATTCDSAERPPPASPPKPTPSSVAAPADLHSTSWRACESAGLPHQQHVINVRVGLDAIAGLEQVVRVPSELLRGHLGVVGASDLETAFRHRRPRRRTHRGAR